MKLLLNEMWTPAIALELRGRHLDVVAITERGQASRYAGITDDQVFARAQEDGRTVVTDNVADYEKARRDWEARGLAHHGVVYALDPPFNRHRGVAVIGEMVRALEDWLRSPDAERHSFKGVHYLRAVERR
jgi:hypothetical protein